MMSELEAFRQEKDAFFKYAPFPQSPLMPEQQREFQGLSYYPENPALRLEVEVQTFANPERVQMLTNTGEVQTYLKWGKFEFEMEGQKAELVIFRDTRGASSCRFRTPPTARRPTAQAATWSRGDCRTGGCWWTSTTLITLIAPTMRPGPALSPQRRTAFGCPFAPERRLLS